MGQKNGQKKLGYSVKDQNRNEYFLISAQFFVVSFLFNTDNHRHLFTVFFNCNARKYGEKFEEETTDVKIVFFRFSFFVVDQTQIHKHSRSLL